MINWLLVEDPLLVILVIHAIRKLKIKQSTKLLLLKLEVEQ